ncbi:MAG TPA: hypothetical protein PK022_02525 [Syntrophales bacterium]|nr:hypothetical protein [Syntrophales bacterium]
MKKSFSLPFILSLGLALLIYVIPVFAGQAKTLTIPKGTKIQKIDPGHFKLTTPDGTVLEITHYKKAGMIGDCKIHDAKGKLVASGTNGTLKGAAGGQTLKNVPSADYITIDDDVTWLPLTIHFPSLRVTDPSGLVEINPQPEPPGGKQLR